MLRLYVIGILLFISQLTAYAQGIRGTIKTTGGDVLPYAAIVVKNGTGKGTDAGTISNTEGRYELPLAPGRYEVVFQYLGFAAQQKTVEVKSGFETIDVVMAEQVIRLQEVQARSTNEDPAYTIMRRAIAKSKYHALQVNSYTARVYGKGSFIVESIPKLIEKMAGKQLKEAEQEANFKVGVPNVFESVSEVSFQQPNTYRRRLIASRNSQSDQLIPAQFSMGSFYSPEINNAVSPLSPKAFAYYKFVYEGTFRESVGGGQAVEISKIRVNPRSWGEGVFRGVIYIIENSWAIHSLQLEQVLQQGFSINLRQTYTPIQNVWMPVNGRFNFKGGIFGVKLGGEAVVSYQYRNLKVNPAFVDEVEVVDEKKFKPETKLTKRDVKEQSLDDLVKKQKEFSTKNMRQMMKEYEKQEAKARREKARQENRDDVQVLRNDSSSVDSLAGKRSTAFWDSLRSVPLTSAEIRSYVRNDSLKIVREIKAKTDSTKAVKKDSTRGSATFKPMQLLEGANWRVGKRTTLQYDTPIKSIFYNTVEGYWAQAGLKLNIRAGAPDTTRKSKTPQFKPGPTWSVGGVVRYGLGWNRAVGYGLAQYAYKTTSVGLEGGRYLSQLNPDNPISNAMNTLTSLVFEQNFLKEYQKDFVRLSGNFRWWHNRLNVSASLEYAERTELANFRDIIRPWINWRNRAYTTNRVTNAEVGSSAFPVHQAFVLNLLASARLGAPRYIIRNGRRISRPNNDAPLLSVNYRKGIAGVGGSDTDYDFLQARISQSFETGIRSRLSYNLSAGAFVNDKRVYFPDFRHFAGNQFFLQQGDPVSVFRLLPYYQYSTGKRFAEAHVLAEYRKFLLTQITWFRLLDLKENLFVHYLATPGSKNYTEVGYGLNGLIPRVLPVFRLEVISQFQNGSYKGLGFRVGTTLSFGR
ncbi:carboxypeptidase-like regulatory domain-containing protein [Rudanella paleaurantiibacter]|uniref:Carboxypeptidase-like regulatory domain-containing protein n=1 Tax=Rudanella paleaurantiibacter TaxID=2614655 RepID=A0A7J5U061_9BACT|nr:DUF5686 and carboxypeptidase regulatory-like domain-containing protein [Rudanella paleaurantiibacter]KAB7731136.1 carboxypeptidase-like regulatory domain-containing protein [Rudanella paleaurantiibacter]